MNTTHIETQQPCAAVVSPAAAGNPQPTLQGCSGPRRTAQHATVAAATPHPTWQGFSGRPGGTAPTHHAIAKKMCCSWWCNCELSCHLLT
jgi:hypothetical protein